MGGVWGTSGKAILIMAHLFISCLGRVFLDGNIFSMHFRPECLGLVPASSVGLALDTVVPLFAVGVAILCTPS